MERAISLLLEAQIVEMTLKHLPIVRKLTPHTSRTEEEPISLHLAEQKIIIPCPYYLRLVLKYSDSIEQKHHSITL